MPRAFTESERSVIRERLISAGEDLFARRGIRSTTVEQLARAAGISKGAFYLFYPSKEELFFSIVEKVESEIQAHLVEQVMAEPSHALRLLLRFALAARDENPLFDVATSEEAVAVMRTMPPEEQQRFLRRDVEMTTELAARLDDAGVCLAVSPTLLAGLLRALVFVGMHRDDVGPDVAPTVEDYLVETLSRALAGDAGARTSTSAGDGAARRSGSPRALGCGQ